jgi:ABC-type multidrug transport system ATPase subunit
MSFKIENVDIGILIKNINLEIDQKGITSILGKNGSGKTTILKLLAGLVIPEKGIIKFGNSTFDFEKLSFLELNKLLYFFRKKIKYIPSSFDFFETATIYQNINYLLRINNISFKKIEKEYMKYMEFLGLNCCLNEEMSSLSHGSKRKILIICSFFFPNEYLILDEPTLGFDAESTAIFFDLIGKLNKTIIISSHELEHVRNISTSIYQIKHDVCVKER